MSTHTEAAGRRHKTPRIALSARAGQTFEPTAAVLMERHLPRATGRARGAQVIDVPRIMAATPCGRAMATSAVGEQGLERVRERSPLLPPERGA